MHCTDESLLEPFIYLSELKGKDVRGLLIDSFQSLLCTPPEILEVIKDIIASLHNASLLIDDIEDSSKLRRGKPVAHSIFGVPSTINCANYVYFLALEKCHALANDVAVAVFIRELLRLHRGQGQDILWRDRGTCPTVEEYELMVLDKTGGLFRLAVGLMQAFGVKNADTDFTGLLDHLGLYFQIRDDYINLSSDEYMQTKSVYEDITEGKFSFPIIHAVRTRPDDSRLLSILRQRTDDLDLKRHAVEWLHKCESMQYTRLRLRTLYEEIVDLIGRLADEGATGLTSIITQLEAQLDPYENIEGISTRIENKISIL